MNGNPPLFFCSYMAPDVRFVSGVEIGFKERRANMDAGEDSP